MYLFLVGWTKNGKATRVSVQKGRSAYRADLSIAKKSSDGDLPEIGSETVAVVIGLAI